MRRRYPTLLTTLGVALAFGLGLQPVSTQADGITGTADYALTSTNALPCADWPSARDAERYPEQHNYERLDCSKCTEHDWSRRRLCGQRNWYPDGNHRQPDWLRWLASDLEPGRDRERAGKPDVYTEYCADRWWRSSSRPAALSRLLLHQVWARSRSSPDQTDSPRVVYMTTLPARRMRMGTRCKRLV